MINETSVNEGSALIRGGVYWVKDHFLNEDEQQQMGETYHPYLIVSSDRNNQGNSSNVTVVMLSTNLSTIAMPTHVFLNGYRNLRPSIVKTESLSTIPKAFIGGRICQVRKGDMMNVDRCLSLVLQLPLSEAEE